MRLFALAALALSVTITAQVKTGRSAEVDANGNAGIIISHKTGAKAKVSPQHAAKFQAYIDDLENNHGSIIKFMGGYRRGHCSSGHMHPCGRAIDVCQLRRGAVDRRCNLPDRVTIAVIAARHGLIEGGRWMNSDYGHAQVGGYSGMDVAEIGSVTTVAARSHKRARHRVAQADFVPADRFTAAY